MDLHLDNEAVDIHPGERRLLSTGLAIQIPQGYEGQVRPRSGLAVKHGVTVLNTPGTIDSDFTGELKVLIINHNMNERFIALRGDRIAQLVIAPVSQAIIEEVTDLAPTERGAGGFGSTGK